MSLFTGKTIEEQNELMNDMKQVMHHLRHSCDNDHKAKHAIETIANKTGLDKERVELLLIHIFKDKQ